MPSYTTSFSSNKKPQRRRSGPGTQLPGARARLQRRPGAQYLNHSQGFSASRPRGRGGRGRRANSRKPYAIIVVGCAFLIFIASILWYANRSVDITLNGSTASVRIGSTIERVIADKELAPRAGRLLAVDDSVLEKEGGDRYSVKLDGKKVALSKLGETRLQGGEELEVSDGADVYEEHEVEATTIQPALTVDGSGCIGYVETWGVAGRKEVWTGKVSGKTVDRGTVKEAVDCVVKWRSVSPSAKGKKYVALTFDEAPGGDMDAILSVLKERGVKATFFLQGSSAAADPAAVAKIARAGHEIGSNAYDDVHLNELFADELRSELSRGFAAVSEAGGGETALLRPSGGLFSESNWAEAMDLVSAVVTWNVDSGDWLLPGAQSVADTVMGSVSNGDVVLLTANESTAAQTAEALPLLIDQLQAKGYELVTLSELIATDEDLSAELDVSSVKMPKGATLPQLAKDADTESADADSAA